MNFKEKAISLMELLLLLVALAKTFSEPEHTTSWFAWSAIAVFASIGLFISIYSDLKQRTFFNDNEKMQWQTRMLIFPPLVIVYLFGVAFKTRI